MDSISARLAQKMTPDMVQDGVWREVAESVGIENMLKVLEVIGGSTIYAPKIDTILRPMRDQLLKEEFTGYNHAELARRYNLTERYTREICGEGHLQNQLSLFDP